MSARAPKQGGQKRTYVDWTSEAFWAAVGLIGTPMLFSHGFPVYAVTIFFISVGSIIWIEYVVRTDNPEQAMTIFAAMLAVLALWHVRNKREEERQAVLREQQAAEQRRFDNEQGWGS